MRPAASLGGDFPALRQAPLVLRPSVMEPKPPPSKKGFLKPKPQRNFVVFDVLAAKKKKKKPVKAPPKPKVVIQMPPPRLAPGKVRKKRLSSLKKRILLERQEKYYQAHPEMRPAASVREEVPWEAFSDATGLEKRFVVRVENACTAPELEDDEEREEILRDVGDICLPMPRFSGGGRRPSDEFVPIDGPFLDDEAHKALRVAEAGRRWRGVNSEPLTARPRGFVVRVYDASTKTSSRTRTAATKSSRTCLG